MANLHLLDGRFLTPDEVNAGKNTAFVNEAFAKYYFAGKSPVGENVKLSDLLMPPAQLTNDTFEIVGVANDIPNVGLQRVTRPEVYIPFTATGYVGMPATLMVSGTTEPASLIKPLED